MEQSLSTLEDGYPDAVKCMKAEAEARQQLVRAKRELSEYQSVFGDLSVLSPDMQALSDQLRQKEDEINRLRLLNTQHTQVGGVRTDNLNITHLLPVRDSIVC